MTTAEFRAKQREELLAFKQAQKQEKEKEKESPRLGKKATLLLDGLLAGREMTKKEWSKELYGDENHQGNIYGLMRKIRDRRGISVVSVFKNPNVFPQEPGVLKIAGQTDGPESLEVNNRTVKELRTRMGAYEKFTLGVIVIHPELTPHIVEAIEDFHLNVLSAKKNIVRGHNKKQIAP